MSHDSWVVDGNWHTYDTQNIVLLGSNPRLPIGDTVNLEDAVDNGLIETLWDEEGESSARPTKKLMDMERKGILRDYVKEIFPEEEE